MNGIEQALKKDKVYIGMTEGDSMFPMILSGQDKVIIVPPKFPLKKYDVPVYKRAGRYTMHRIIKVTKNGYHICGDNRSHIEKDITDSDIIGVLAAFYHKGRLIACTDKQYIRYAKKICRTLLFRILKRKVSRYFKKI